MPEVSHNNVTCTSPGYISGVLCLKQGSRAGASNYIPQILQDVITCLCIWYLLSLSSLKKTTSSHLSWFLILVTCRWTCITTGVLLTPNDALELNPFSQEKFTKFGVSRRTYETSNSITQRDLNEMKSKQFEENRQEWNCSNKWGTQPLLSS